MTEILKTPTILGGLRLDSFNNWERFVGPR